MCGVLEPRMHFFQGDSVKCPIAIKFEMEWKVIIGFGSWEVTGNLSKSIFNVMIEAKGKMQCILPLFCLSLPSLLPSYGQDLNLFKGCGVGSCEKESMSPERKL